MKKSKLASWKVPAATLAFTIFGLIAFSLIFSIESPSPKNQLAPAQKKVLRISSLPENGKLEGDISANAQKIIEKRIADTLARYDYDDPRPMVFPDSKLGYSQYLNYKPVTPLPKIRIEEFKNKPLTKIQLSNKPIAKLKAYPEKVPYPNFDLPKLGKRQPLPPLKEKIKFTPQCFINNELHPFVEISEIKIENPNSISSATHLYISRIDKSFLCTVTKSCGVKSLDSQAKSLINLYFLKESLKNDNNKADLSIQIKIDWIKL